MSAIQLGHTMLWISTIDMWIWMWMYEWWVYITRIQARCSYMYVYMYVYTSMYSSYILELEAADAESRRIQNVYGKRRPVAHAANHWIVIGSRCSVRLCACFWCSRFVYMRWCDAHIARAIKIDRCIAQRHRCVCMQRFCVSVEHSRIYTSILCMYIHMTNAVAHLLS